MIQWVPGDWRHPRRLPARAGLTNAVEEMRYSDRDLPLEGLGVRAHLVHACSVVG